MKRWIEIKAAGPAASKDDAVSSLIEAGSPGVIEDAPSPATGRLVAASRWDAGGGEPEGEPGQAEGRARVTAYLPDDAAGRIKGLRRVLKEFGWSIRTGAPFRDRDWSREWRKGIRPVRVSYGGRSVVVAPTWSKRKRGAGEVLVEVDPGMAFGTGGHPTTRLCLASLLYISSVGLLKPGGSTLLDVGTGSGVLAIAAGKLGFRRVVGIDVDPVALRVARKNARLNSSGVVISSKGVEEVPGRYTVVAANILSGVLIELAPHLAEKASGFLILSGVLTHQVREVLDAYGPLGFRVIRRNRSGEWASLVLQRKDQGR